MERTILIVDDDKVFRDLFGKRLTKAGYITVQASSGKKALKILKKEEIPVMFLDLNMPGMDGLELCMQIRKDYKLVCIFAITGHTDIYKLLDCYDAGFDDYGLCDLFPPRIRWDARGRDTIRFAG